jgi:hypothetical protein
LYKTLEHNEHASHLAHGHGHDEPGEHGHDHPLVPAKGVPAHLAALTVAIFAAALALTEQGAKHAEIRVQQDLIAATDAWAQYQAKSTRATLSGDLIQLIGAMDTTTGTDAADRRKEVVAKLQSDQERFEKDPKDGKEAIAVRAREFERERDHALEQTHAYHNGAAALELGIVLTTASAIIGSRLLIGFALVLGVIGAAFALGGFFAPELAAI